MRMRILLAAAFALTVAGCQAPAEDAESAPEPSAEASAASAPQEPEPEPAATDDDEICGAFRVVAREGSRIGQPDLDADIDRVLREFEATVARASPSTLRDLADEWLDVMYADHDPQLAAVAQGFVVLLMTDGDTSSEPYRRLLEAGQIDDAEARELFDYVMSQAAETGETVPSIVQRLDPQLSSAVDDRIRQVVLDEELRERC